MNADYFYDRSEQRNSNHEGRVPATLDNIGSRTMLILCSEGAVSSPKITEVLNTSPKVVE